MSVPTRQDIDLPDVQLPEKPDPDNVLTNITDWIIGHPLVIPCLLIALFAIAAWRRPFTRNILLLVLGGVFAYAMFK